MQHDEDEFWDAVEAEERASPLTKLMAITIFPTKGAQRKRVLQLSLRGLAGHVMQAFADKKADLPWLKCASFGNRRTPLRPNADGTGRTGNSLRNNENVLFITGIEGDYDSGPISPKEAQDRLKRAGITGMVYETPSHLQEGKGNRWRVIVPTSKELSPTERHKLVCRLNGLFDGGLDNASFTISQAFLYGSVTGQKPIKTHLIEGHRYIDEAEDLDAGAIGKRSRERANDNGKEGGFDEAALIEDILSGANYHGSSISLIGH